MPTSYDSVDSYYRIYPSTVLGRDDTFTIVSTGTALEDVTYALSSGETGTYSSSTVTFSDSRDSDLCVFTISATDMFSSSSGMQEITYTVVDGSTDLTIGSTSGGDTSGLSEFDSVDSSYLTLDKYTLSYLETNSLAFTVSFDYSLPIGWYFDLEFPSVVSITTSPGDSPDTEEVDSSGTSGDLANS